MCKGPVAEETMVSAVTSKSTSVARGEGAGAIQCQTGLERKAREGDRWHDQLNERLDE